MSGRVLAVDPGDKRLGIAISDPTATLARPLLVLKHIARQIDASQIVRLAEENEVVKIIVGWALDEDGIPTPQARSSARLAEALREQTSLPVEMWDESGSTQAARAARLNMGVSRRKRSGHLDEVAAAMILQTYLDAQNRPSAEMMGLDG